MPIFMRSPRSHHRPGRPQPCAPTAILAGPSRAAKPWLPHSFPGFPDDAAFRARTIGGVTILRMDHVGVIVDDLAAATEFFVQLGFARQGGGMVEGSPVDRIVGLEGVRSEVAFVQTPDGHGRLELIKFHSPPAGGDRHAPANTWGLRHIAIAVDDIQAAVEGLRARGVELVGELVNYEDVYWLCYVRGPEGIIVELAEKIG
jgi:catechol 2,3-dioxygenase-like lactoylglutathione lyase family enzyme